MTDDESEYSGTVLDTLHRLKRSYPGSSAGGEDVDTKLMAADLIVLMKVSGRSKKDFLHAMGMLWDDINLESYQ